MCVCFRELLSPGGWPKNSPTWLKSTQSWARPTVASNEASPKKLSSMRMLQQQLRGIVLMAFAMRWQGALSNVTKDPMLIGRVLCTHRVHVHEDPEGACDCRCRGHIAIAIAVESINMFRINTKSGVSVAWHSFGLGSQIQIFHKGSTKLPN